MAVHYKAGSTPKSPDHLIRCGGIGGPATLLQRNIGRRAGDSAYQRCSARVAVGNDRKPVRAFAGNAQRRVEASACQMQKTRQAATPIFVDFSDHPATVRIFRACHRCSFTVERRACRSPRGKASRKRNQKDGELGYRGQAVRLRERSTETVDHQIRPSGVDNRRHHQMLVQTNVRSGSSALGNARTTAS